MIYNNVWNLIFPTKFMILLLKLVAENSATTFGDLPDWLVIISMAQCKSAVSPVR